MGIDSLTRRFLDFPIFPKFAENYEPFFVVRYTGEMNVGWNNGKDIIIGGRVLIMPRSQTKEGTDI